MAPEPDLPELSGAQKRWALAAAALFVFSIGFLGFALSNGVLAAFAIGWVALQIFGYVGSLQRAKGDFSHPLFKSQVILHCAAVGLLAMVIFGGRAG